jgi:hypothetical protein
MMKAGLALLVRKLVFQIHVWHPWFLIRSENKHFCHCFAQMRDNHKEAIKLF